MWIEEEKMLSWWLSFLLLLLPVILYLRQRSTRPKNGETGLPFSRMPGPRSLAFIGTLHLYYWTRIYSFSRLHWNGWAKFKEFGWIVRERILPGVNIVWLFDPADIKKLYESEGKYPSRRSHTALGHFRLARPDKYNTAGLLPTNGAQWKRIRSQLERPMATALSSASFLPQLEDVAVDAVAYVTRHAHVVREDLLPHLNRIFMEMTGAIVFDTRLNSLQEPLSPETTAARLIVAAEQTNSNILQTDNGFPFWLVWETPAYRAIRTSQEYIQSVAEKYLQKKIDLLEDDGKAAKHVGHSQQLALENKNLFEETDEEKQRTLLERWLASPQLDTKDVMTGIAEFLLAGVHTSSYTFAFLLHHLARSPRAQQLLREEAGSLRQHSFTGRERLSRAVYAKACLRESLRLNPVSVGVGRILPQDTLLGGYHVPKGTVCVTQNQVISRFPEFFPEPGDFIPERWIPGTAQFRPVDQHVVLPFGKGPRACIGKHIAEASMLTLVMELVLAFSMEAKEDDDDVEHKDRKDVDIFGGLDCLSLLINKPDQPVKIQFTKLNSD